MENPSGITINRSENSALRYFVYGALILFALLHLYRVSAPPNGYHQWRESDTAAVILNFYQENHSPLVPLTNELKSSAVITSIELPIYCYLSALGYFLLGPNHIAAHLLTIIAGCVGLWFFYRLTTLVAGKTAAVFSVWALAFSPLYFFYNFKMMPEIMMICFLLAGIYLFLRYINNRSISYFLLSAFCLSLAVSTKPFILSIYILLLYLLWKNKFKFKQIVWIIPLHFVIAIIPLLSWMIYSAWLVERSTIIFSFYDYFFTSLFFKKFFLQWPYELWVGWILLPAFLYGLYKSIKNRENRFNFVWMGAAFIALVFMARYSRQHDYYSLFLIPAFAGITGYGLASLYKKGKNWRIVVYILIILAPVGAFLRIADRFGNIEDFYSIRRDVADIIPPHSKVVVEDNTRGALRLYQLNRKGWYVRTGDDYAGVLQAAKDGAEFLIVDRAVETYNDSLRSFVTGEPKRLGPVYCYTLKINDSTNINGQ